MFQRICFAAIAAGLLAGVLISVVQSVTTTPIILHAEEFESGQHQRGDLRVPSAGTAAARLDATTNHVPHLVTVADSGHAADESWAPGEGLERTFFTTLTNLIVGVGFALFVVAGMALSGKPVTVGAGVLWGAAGFVAFTLAPALGLPPEVPGSMVAGLEERQMWWAFAVAGAALGLGLLVFTRALHWQALGVVALALPHIVGAPSPQSIGGNVPPELAGHFAAASIVVGAIFWVLIGGFSAAFYRRLA
jgi:cobalt transporter subunit CbtA